MVIIVRAADMLTSVSWFIIRVRVTARVRVIDTTSRNRCFKQLLDAVRHRAASIIQQAYRKHLANDRTMEQRASSLPPGSPTKAANTAKAATAATATTTATATSAVAATAAKAAEPAADADNTMDAASGGAAEGSLQTTPAGNSAESAVGTSGDSGTSANAKVCTASTSSEHGPTGAPQGAPAAAVAGAGAAHADTTGPVNCNAPSG